MCKLKVGQTVQCIDHSNFDWIRDNGPFIIRRIYNDEIGIAFVELKDKHGEIKDGYFARRFARIPIVLNNIKVL